jgi:hypothetical protein
LPVESCIRCRSLDGLPMVSKAALQVVPTQKSIIAGACTSFPPVKSIAFDQPGVGVRVATGIQCEQDAGIKHRFAFLPQAASEEACDDWNVNKLA